MSKDFTLYPEAFELKQLGFDEPCFAWYHLGDTLLSDITMGYEKTDFLYTQDDMEETQCTAPTYSQAFRFFREKFKLQTYIDFYHSQSYFYKIKSQEGKVIGKTGDVILQGTPLSTRTYEEAELACLRRLIKLVKNYGEVSNERQDKTTS
jgi:hypothetical protein